MEELVASLSDRLSAASLRFVTIHVTKEIEGEVTNLPRLARTDFLTKTNYKMVHAN